jgi:hypothetical protein
VIAEYLPLAVLADASHANAKRLQNAAGMSFKV